MKRLPAEWEEQQAVWLAWPINENLWPESLAIVKKRLAAFIGRISSFTPVHLICAKSHQQEAEGEIYQGCALLNNIHFFDFTTDDVWCRDFAPIFYKNEGNQTAISNWQFNAWGEKFANFQNDNAIPRQIADKLRLPHLEQNIILEGGAIESNGSHCLLTTEEVLLNENRNRGVSKKDYEKYFAETWGTRQIIWLKQGIHNDDTDGHIDNLARFFSENGVLLAGEADATSPNYCRLLENKQILQEVILVGGKSLEIIELPLPDPVIFQGEPLPASYLNFFITNKLVLVPTYNQSQKDKQALEILQQCFSNHRVEGLDCRYFLQEGGALHCLTQAQF